MRIYKYIIILFLIFALPSHSSEMPDVFLKNTVKEVSAFISDNKAMLESDERYLKSKVNEIVIPKLDILLMSKIVLGKKHWLDASKSQRMSFQNAFKSLMVRTYMKSLTAFDGEKIIFLPFKKGKNARIAKVKSLYLISNGDIAVNYRLKSDDNGRWRVFDIIFDGVSLLKNYRADFQQHINKKGLDSLINEINGKN